MHVKAHEIPIPIPIQSPAQPFGIFFPHNNYIIRCLTCEEGR